jgi:hypothetical protein
VRSLRPDTGGARDDDGLGLRVDQLSSFGVDDRRHLYAASLSGSVYRFVSR